MKKVISVLFVLATFRAFGGGLAFVGPEELVFNQPEVHARIVLEKMFEIMRGERPLAIVRWENVGNEAELLRLFNGTHRFMGYRALGHSRVPSQVFAWTPTSGTTTVRKDNPSIRQGCYPR